MGGNAVRTSGGTSGAPKDVTVRGKSGFKCIVNCLSAPPKMEIRMFDVHWRYPCEWPWVIDTSEEPFYID
jgi:hypothetical protein